MKRKTEQSTLVVTGAQPNKPAGEVEERPVQQMVVGVDDPDDTDLVRDEEPSGPVAGRCERNGRGEPTGDRREAHLFRGCRSGLFLIDSPTSTGEWIGWKYLKVPGRRSPPHPGHTDLDISRDGASINE